MLYFNLKFNLSRKIKYLPAPNKNVVLGEQTETSTHDYKKHISSCITSETCFISES